MCLMNIILVESAASVIIWLPPVVVTVSLDMPLKGSVTDKLSVTLKFNSFEVRSVLTNVNVGVNVAMLFYFMFLLSINV